MTQLPILPTLERRRDAGLSNKEHRLITPRSEEWPRLLSELGPHLPPRELYAIGLPLLDPERAIAIVGTRRPSIAGLEAARRFARGIAEAGYAVVSGLAHGVDAAAHRAALEGAGTTIAVLGCGLDVEYPRRNSALKRQIAARGTVVTEYPQGTPAMAHHFPSRNRIIVGLSAGVILVEGGEKSGALITARIAIDANRHVFAVPGSMRNPMATAPNELIRNGEAALVTELNHVFQELAPDLVWTEPVEPLRAARPALSEQEANVLRLLDDEPVTPDAICSELEEAPGQVALTLAKLEVRGLIHRRRAGYEISQSGARLRAFTISRR